VLVNPGFPSETAGAFRLLDEFRSAQPVCGAGTESGEQALIQALETPPRNWPFRNDFLPVFEGQTQNTGKTYRDIIARLRELGADFAGLTGAGSTCFGVFTQRALAEKARKSLLKTWNSTIITFPLAFEDMQY
jgi:4-diphosphocytidyl-2-C-methyl-D-erythritol kinase